MTVAADLANRADRAHARRLLESLGRAVLSVESARMVLEVAFARPHLVLRRMERDGLIRLDSERGLVFLR